MEKLINALEKLYQGTNNSYTVDCDGFMHTYFNDCEEVQIAEDLCCEYIIARGGDCNWDNIRILENAGYRVFAEEQDSFGWLIGCVMKKGDSRRLTFG